MILRFEWDYPCGGGVFKSEIRNRGDGVNRGRGWLMEQRCDQVGHIPAAYVLNTYSTCGAVSTGIHSVTI